MSSHQLNAPETPSAYLAHPKKNIVKPPNRLTGKWDAAHGAVQWDTDAFQMR
jgi:hypothetical protein